MVDQRMNAAHEIQISEEDRLRSELYNFLGLILARAPDATLLAQIAGLTGDDSVIGKATVALAKLARRTGPASIESEYNRLFIGLGRGELLPYASYYLTGFLNEKPLAQLRRDMASQGLARAENVFEPEDNISSLMEMMAALITGQFSAPADLDSQRNFFNRHIAPWAVHFFTDLEAAKNAVFYAPVGRLGRAFMEIEAEAFRMSVSPSTSLASNRREHRGEFQ